MDDLHTKDVCEEIQHKTDRECSILEIEEALCGKEKTISFSQSGHKEETVVIGENSESSSSLKLSVFRPTNLISREMEMAYCSGPWENMKENHNLAVGKINEILSERIIPYAPNNVAKFFGEVLRGLERANKPPSFYCIFPFIETVVEFIRSYMDPSSLNLNGCEPHPTCLNCKATTPRKGAFCHCMQGGMPDFDCFKDFMYDLFSAWDEMFSAIVEEAHVFDPALRDIEKSDVINFWVYHFIGSVTCKPMDYIIRRYSNILSLEMWMLMRRFMLLDPKSPLAGRFLKYFLERFAEAFMEKHWLI